MSFEEAVRRFDSLHRQDPRRVVVAGEETPWSLFYHRQLSRWVHRLDPAASEPMRLAACCQHLLRWTIPRNSYPQGRAGYREWRDALARVHSEEAATVLRDAGFDAATIERVSDFLLKRGLGQDPEVQLFEDAICLAFLENELADFARKHPTAKVMRVLKKTWRKMSPKGRTAAEQVIGDLPPQVRELVRGAVEGDQSELEGRSRRPVASR